MPLWQQPLPLKNRTVWENELLPNASILRFSAAKGQYKARVCNLSPFTSQHLLFFGKRKTLFSSTRAKQRNNTNKTVSKIRKKSSFPLILHSLFWHHFSNLPKSVLNFGFPKAKAQSGKYSDLWILSNHGNGGCDGISPNFPLIRFFNGTAQRYDFKFYGFSISRGTGFVKKIKRETAHLPQMFYA